MDEVSVRVFQFYSQNAERLGLDLERLTANLPSVRALRERGTKWYDWDDHVVLCERFEELCGGAAQAEAASTLASNQKPVTGPLRALAMQLAQPKHLYWAGFRWFGRSLYRHLEFQYEELDGGRLRATLEIPEGYKACSAFFRMWRGGLRGTPRMMGLPDSLVLADITPRRGVFTIVPPQSRDLPTRIRRRLRALTSGLKTAELLVRHEEQLREAYEALVRSEQEFRAMMEATPDAVLLARDGLVVYANRALVAALGVPAIDEVLGQPVIAWFHPADRAQAQRWLEGRDDGRPSWEFRWARGGAEGAFYEAAPVRTAQFQGQPATLLTARDVTARRQAEAAQRQSEESQRALLDALPDVILWMRRDGQVLGAKGQSRHPLFEPLASLKGANLSALPERAPGIEPEFVLGVLAEARAVTDAAHAKVLECAAQAPSGERLFFEWRIAALDADQVLCMVRDVSHQKRLELQLRLTERLASLGTLAAGVAHEVNNPLTVVLGSLESLERPGQPGAAGLDDEAVRLARQASERIRDIIRDLKAFTQQDDAKLEPVEIHPLLESTLRLAANHLRHRASVHRSFGELPRVWGNASRLGQVFLNLIMNAAQALPEDHVAQNRIELRTRRDGAGRAVVEVVDNGSGIAPALLARIFDPFFTTKPVGEGMGLGLAICHRIVSDLGGQIEVESELDRGTVFRVLLPAAPEESARPPAPSPAGSQRARVLIIDDQPNVARTLQMLLRQHRVEVASGGREGLSRLEQERFDVVLCDLMMPDVSGLELYRLVESRWPGHERRIIFMTGGVFTPAAQQFLDAIPNPRLLKPFRSEVLEQLIDTVLSANQGAETPLAS